MVDPEVMYVLTTVGGYLAGAATSWWVQNRGKVVDSLQDAAADAIDKIEETTGIDIQNAVEDLIEDVEDAVDVAANAAEEAIEAGDLEAAAKAVKDSLVKSTKDKLDVSLEDLEDLTVAGLRERLTELGLPTKGRKADLIARITDYIKG